MWHVPGCSEVSPRWRAVSGVVSLLARGIAPLTGIRQVPPRLQCAQHGSVPYDGGSDNVDDFGLWLHVAQDTTGMARMRRCRSDRRSLVDLCVRLARDVTLWITMSDVSSKSDCIGLVSALAEGRKQMPFG